MWKHELIDHMKWEFVASHDSITKMYRKFNEENESTFLEFEARTEKLGLEALQLLSAVNSEFFSLESWSMKWQACYIL